MALHVCNSLNKTQPTPNPRTGNLAAEQPIRQPWKAFWPPKGAGDPEIWRGSEFPEVVSWRFDANRPFDRPWRKWTRTARARKEESVTSSEEQEHDETNFYNSENNPQAECAKRLDSQIRRAELKAITPASFNYLAPLAIYHSEKPYLSRLPSLSALVRTNIVGRSQMVQIHEVSGNEQLFTLDQSGFEFTQFPVPIQDWTDFTVREAYIPKLADWLRGYLNCSRVYIYAYNFRGKDPGREQDGPWKKPFFRVHCDATAESCSKRLRLYIPDEAELLIHKRVRFLNIWRPITTPIQNSPLALCDFRTVSPSDLVQADIVFPHYLDEAYEVLYNPAHRWFYKQGMKDGDVVLFKLADSAENKAKFCPHSAFVDPSVPKDTPERASVEVRAIVFE